MHWCVKVLLGIMNSKHNQDEVRVLANTPWGLNGKRLRIDINQTFTPGQWVSLSAANNPRLGSRMYSIASSPEEPWTDLLYTLVPNGVLTPWMNQLKPGDLVQVSRPAGSFVPKPIPSLFIAAGTGIAPFLSMTKLIQTGWFSQHSDQSRPWLLHSNRSGQDLFGYHTFSILSAHRLINYQPFITGIHSDSFQVISRDLDSSQVTLSKPTELPEPQRSRITTWINDHPNPQWFSSFKRIMICGSTQMILDIREVLLEKGVDFQSLVSEVYF
jgi:ferredoxin--NADP+ reductase